MMRIKHSLAASLAFRILALSFLPILAAAIFSCAIMLDTLTDLLSEFQQERAENLAAWYLESGNSTVQRRLDSNIPGINYSFILSQDGNYLISPEGQKEGRPAEEDFSKEILAQILSGKSGSFFDNSTNQIIGYAPVAGQGLIAVSVLDRAGYFPFYRIQTTFIIFLAICLMIITMVTGLAVWFTIGRPLRQLTRTAELIGMGNLQEKANETGLSAELLTMAESFNHMSSHLGDLILGLEKNVTELEQTHDALQESEGRFRTIFNNINDCIIVCDLDGNIIEFNDRMSELFGYTRKEAMQLQVGILSTDQPPFTREAVEKKASLAASGTPQFFEWGVKSKSGVQFWVGINMRRALIGNHDRLLIAARNITERKRAELVQFALYEISEAAHTAHDLEGLFRLIHAIIAEMMPARNCFVAIYDPEKDLVSFPYHVDEYDQDEAFWTPRKPSGGLATHVMRTGKPILLRMEDEDRLEQGGLAERIGTLSVDWLGVPLKSFDNITFGVLAVQTYTEGIRYTSHDRDLLALVSTQIGMAVERFHVQEALRSSEERFRSLVDNLGEGISSVDSEEYVIFMNPAGEQIFGIKTGRMVGHNIKEFIPPEQVSTFDDQNLKRQRGEKSTYEVDIIRLGGERRMLQVTGEPRFDEDGNFLGTSAIFHDITDRKKAEEALSKAEARYRQLIEQINMVVYLDSMGVPAQPLYISPQIKTLLGYSPEEWLQDPELQVKVIHPDDQEMFVAEDNRTDLSGEPFLIEYRAYSRDGHLVWIHDEAVLVLGKEGKPEAWHGVMYDITSRKTAEEAVSRAEVRYRQLVEKIRAVTYLDAVDEQSTTLFISPQVELLTGYPAEEWLSDSNLWLDIIHPDDREQVFAENIQSNKSGEDFCEEYRLITRDGRIIWVHDEASMLCDSKGEPEAWHGVMYDVTERKWAEEELQNAHRSLAEAYDATIEGWSRALDLRDRETEGHTLRVTGMAVQFAEVLDIDDEEIKHIYRGCLLHDIGKMGVPDHILQKPGPLTDNEWEIMRLHPFYAYQMLSPIAYLRPALNIPYCHHEKWDGSGYPRGLKAEEVPLSARMFAIVDVWDALCSVRPYRRAWPEDKVIDYIRSQSGTHFEPRLVDIFLQLLGRTSGMAG